MSEPTISIGLFYGSTTCYTEMAAEKIQGQLNTLFDEEVVTLHNIKDDSLSLTQHYDIVIFGISTWDFGELQEDWESHWEEVHTLNLDGKIIALFGLGDQYGYADWFQDALGMLHDAIAPSNCKVIGHWPNSGYEFTQSKALNEDKTHFVGLSLDDENQFDQTDERIAQWCEQILVEMSS
ncbi:flavodoxin FldB [Alteromonas sp. KUL49]|uniref:flavodoxin FldB n=1 Tax=Alteromonas sp. KUL49 TaxID=2480798 RepID=UPI00102F1C34|nr:flavodoxin FldB [Alteromonas sp. KUL49]TAP34957.1 flavodoxin FldB [Alteromonas sp. KUL49]GEA13500.1 flavodoxin [Alteromonas sp. KUL49]